MPPGMDEHTPLVQRVHIGCLTGVHQWSYEPERGISFRQRVEEDRTPRLDMQRFKAVASIDLRKARLHFSKLCSSRTLFAVPDTISCDRTFVRDVEEVYYLDAMDHYLKGNDGQHELDPSRIPLLRRSLSHRAFSAFSKRPKFFSELYDRIHYGLWIPHDAFESLEFSYADLVSLFPRTEEWQKLIKQPSALPVPVPFVVYYFHKELTAGQDVADSECTERLKRLRFCLKYEYLMFFMVVWWNEAIYGSRLYHLTEETINYLDEMCGNLPPLCGKPVQAILEHMRNTRTKASKYENWMYFTDETLEFSVFFWAVAGTGEFDHERIAGRSFYQDLKLRKIRNAKQTVSRDQIESVLDRTIRGHELNSVSGLSAIVSRERWDSRGPLSVRMVLDNLVDLYTVTRARLNSHMSTEALYSARHDDDRTFAVKRGRSYNENEYSPYSYVYDGYETYEKRGDDDDGWNEAVEQRRSGDDGNRNEGCLKYIEPCGEQEQESGDRTLGQKPYAENGDDADQSERNEIEQERRERKRMALRMNPYAEYENNDFMANTTSGSGYDLMIGSRTTTKVVFGPTPPSRSPTQNERSRSKSPRRPRTPGPLGYFQRNYSVYGTCGNHPWSIRNGQDGNVAEQLDNEVQPSLKKPRGDGRK